VPTLSMSRLQMPDQSIKYLHIVAHGTRDEDADWSTSGPFRT